MGGELRSAEGWQQASQYTEQLETQENRALVSSVKTYERVDGATITGDAAAGEDVVVALPLESDTGRPFTYVQSAEAGENGTFEITVPYATDDQLGPEDGYTDSAVTATDDYTVLVGDELDAAAVSSAPIENGEIDLSELDADVRTTGTTDVPEPAIYDGDERTVDLDEN
ncbi:hypothetical protein ACFQH2_11195 [Natronoarchaeum sp. GCM10025703]|uniref:hypothetical protein n=1 Tax=Natronoarchaeum sp. GCM10025703 TaxID=3252685 RepID=UPI00361CBB78